LIHADRLTWNLRVFTPGKGKASFKPSFSGSMLISGSNVKWWWWGAICGDNGGGGFFRFYEGNKKK